MAVAKQNRSVADETYFSEVCKELKIVDKCLKR